jgi:hypothetical protein
MIKNGIWRLLALSLTVTPAAAAPEAHVDKPTETTRQIIAEFAETVKGVIPSQIDTNKMGNDPHLQLWRRGTEDVMSYQNWGNNSYTRNPHNVLQVAGISLSAISVPSWLPALNQQQLYATAISPQHIIASAHWHPAVGQAIYFVDDSSHAISRLITAEKQLIDPNGGTTDLWLGKLDSPLPASIKPFKVLPANYQTILDIKTGIPAWVCQGGNTTTSNLWTASGKDDAASYPPTPSKGFDVNFTQHSGAYAAWNTTIHGGSGSPIFMVVNKQPVLISILHYMNGTTMLGGPSIADLATQINTVLADLDEGKTSYRLTEAEIK